MTKSPIERFLVKVEWGEKFQGTRCLLWTGETNGRGYGRFKVENKKISVHRWLYGRWVGLIPDGLQLDHLCRNRACVNPDHLEPVTSRENTLRGMGLTAQNATKTHCPAGHEYTPPNTHVNKAGSRICRECNRLRVANIYWKDRA